MAKSRPASVDEYLHTLSPEQMEVISTVRDLILRNLPKGFRESTTWGYPTYEIPLERYPDTYNGQPLCYAALAAQKNYFSLYLMNVYRDPKLEEWLASEFKRRGKNLDMGRSCLRFKRLDDLPLDVIGEVISKTTPEAYIAKAQAARSQAQAARSQRTAARPARARKKTARKTAARKKTAKKK